MPRPRQATILSLPGGSRPDPNMRLPGKTTLRVSDILFSSPNPPPKPKLLSGIGSALGKLGRNVNVYHRLARGEVFLPGYYVLYKKPVAPGVSRPTFVWVGGYWVKAPKRGQRWSPCHWVPLGGYPPRWKFVLGHWE